MSESSHPSPSLVDVDRLLLDSGAVLRGHFLLTSGRHSDVYFEKFRVLERPEALCGLCAVLAGRFRGQGFDLVAGPTTGGIIVAFEVARQLGLPALYVESEDGKKKLRRGARVPEGTRVLVVDDVLTTGRSVFEVIELIEAEGASVGGVGVLIDRSEKPLEFGCPLQAAHKVAAVSYAPDSVPDWLAAIPISKPGSRPTP